MICAWDDLKQAYFVDQRMAALVFSFADDHISCVQACLVVWIVRSFAMSPSFGVVDNRKFNWTLV